MAGNSEALFGQYVAGIGQASRTGKDWPEKPTDPKELAIYNRALVYVAEAIVQPPRSYYEYYGGVAETGALTSTRQHNRYLDTNNNGDLQSSMFNDSGLFYNRDAFVPTDKNAASYKEAISAGRAMGLTVKALEAQRTPTPGVTLIDYAKTDKELADHTFGYSAHDYGDKYGTKILNRLMGHSGGLPTLKEPEVKQTAATAPAEKPEVKAERWEGYSPLQRAAKEVLGDASAAVKDGAQRILSSELDGQDYEAQKLYLLAHAKAALENKQTVDEGRAYAASLAVIVRQHEIEGWQAGKPHAHDVLGKSVDYINGVYKAVTAKTIQDHSTVPTPEDVAPVKPPTSDEQAPTKPAPGPIAAADATKALDDDALVDFATGTSTVKDKDGKDITFNNVLFRGDHTIDPKFHDLNVALQQSANRVAGGLGVDGIFGSQTEDKIKEIQAAYGIHVDGKAAINTIAALQIEEVKTLVGALAKDGLTDDEKKEIAKEIADVTKLAKTGKVDPKVLEHVNEVLGALKDTGKIENVDADPVLKDTIKALKEAATPAR